MSKTIFAGIYHDSHDEIGGFMYPESVRQFQERIEPQLTSNSLILMESFDHPELIRRSNRLYPRTLQAFGVSFRGIAPTFGGFDPRSHKNAEKRDRVVRRAVSWSYVADELFGTDLQLASYEEALASLNEGRYARKLHRSPTKEEIDLAHWMLMKNREFDRRYLTALSRYSSRFDCCVFVAGAAHALSLAIQKKLPLEVLMDQEVADRFIVYGYLSYYVWPEIVANYGR